MSKSNKSNEVLRFGFEMLYWSASRYWLLQAGYSEERVDELTGRDSVGFSLKRFKQRYVSKLDPNQQEAFRLHLRRHRLTYLEGIYTGAEMASWANPELAQDEGDIEDAVDSIAQYADHFKGGKLQ